MGNPLVPAFLKGEEVVWTDVAREAGFEEEHGEGPFEIVFCCRAFSHNERHAVEIELAQGSSETFPASSFRIC